MTRSRREEMQRFRELAVQVEQRLAQHRREASPEDNVDHLIVEAGLDLPEPVPEVVDFDCDQTATSETLPTDINSSFPSQPPEIPSTTSSPRPEESQRHPLDGFFSPKLIRSNSYTLDQPSPMLLKFLDSAGTIPSDKRPSSEKKPHRSRTLTTKTPSPGNRKKTPRKMSDPSKLRGIYGIKTSPRHKQKAESLDDTKRRLKIHSRGEKVEKFFMKSKTVKEFENLTQQPKTKDFSPETSPEKLNPVASPMKDNKSIYDPSLDITDISLATKDLGEEDDNTITAQKEEKSFTAKSLLDHINLHHQQQPKHLHLLQKLQELNLMDRTSTPNHLLGSIEDINNTERGEKDTHFNDTSFYSTIRGESPVCSMSLVSDAYSKQYFQSLRSFNMSPTSIKDDNEQMAATIINSYVRGYLVRRLLRTEFVQNIIDNIRNILFMILDANPKEIQLKRTYLLKLNANCEKLHDVFFKFTTSERMEVISKDRELLMARLSQRRAKRSSNFGNRVGVK